MVSPKLKILLLLAGQIVAGMAPTWVGEKEINGFRIAPLGWLALVFADAGLIGIWGGIATTRLAWRLPAVLAMTASLSAIAITAMRAWDDERRAIAVLALVASPTALIFGVLCRMRLGRRQLRLARMCSTESPTREGFQFTIRHLFLATTAVAVVLAIGRVVRTDSVSLLTTALFLATFTPCMIMVQLATLWATLGTGRPSLRLAAVLPTAFVVGLIPPFYTEEPVRSKLVTFVFLSVIFGLQAIITAASLLVFRSCGWRLVRRTAENKLAGVATNSVIAAAAQPPGA